MILKMKSQTVVFLMNPSKDLVDLTWESVIGLKYSGTIQNQERRLTSRHSDNFKLIAWFRTSINSWARTVLFMKSVAKRDARSRQATAALPSRIWKVEKDLTCCGSRTYEVHKWKTAEKVIIRKENSEKLFKVPLSYHNNPHEVYPGTRNMSTIPLFHRCQAIPKG